MEIQTCSTCGAKWIEGKHYWSTGKEGNELDLAGLVCNRLTNDRPCINPSKGQTGGQTWESRQGLTESFLKKTLDN